MVFIIYLFIYLFIIYYLLFIVYLFIYLFIIYLLLFIHSYLQRMSYKWEVRNEILRRKKLQHTQWQHDHVLSKQLFVGYIIIRPRVVIRSTLKLIF